MSIHAFLADLACIRSAYDSNAPYQNMLFKALGDYQDSWSWRDMTVGELLQLINETDYEFNSGK